MNNNLSVAIRVHCTVNGVPYCYGMMTSRVHCHEISDLSVRHVTISEFSFDELNRRRFILCFYSNDGILSDGILSGKKKMKKKSCGKWQPHSPLQFNTVRRSI